ncbi:MAG: glucose 1-dehydrogenase [bacterium]|nr:3-alpha-hydroxysteroid dehydrogenase [Deltaproteobacteria bacterium]MCP4908892.1 glucose 1-dehydrogenase [bacterium]
MAGRLDGKVAIITGGARGQGEAEARLFAAEGARVVVADVLEELGRAVASSIGEAARFERLDVSSEEDWTRVVGVAVDHFGSLTTLVNNAGIVAFSAFEETSLEEYMRVINVNQVGTFLGMRSSIAALSEAGGGSIVNVASVEGIRGSNGLVSYGSSKWAIRGLSKIGSVEFARRGIRVNTLLPGSVATPMSALPPDTEVDSQAIVADRPIQRAGTPEELAQAALFLAADESSYISGAELVVDGAWTAGSLIRGMPGHPG